MSHSMRLKSDPRDGKGMCSDCAYLWVMETETHGGEKIFCMPSGDEDSSMNFVIPIRRKITACTRYKQTPRGNFSQFDAWHVKREHDGTYLRKDSTRFIDGKYQEHVYREGGYVWVDVEDKKEVAVIDAPLESEAGPTQS
jgi:hypothetical protein